MIDCFYRTVSSGGAVETGDGGFLALCHLAKKGHCLIFLKVVLQT